jgi:hypothetical protein
MYTTFVNISYVLLFLNFILYVMRFYKTANLYHLLSFLIITVQVIAHICTELYGDNLFLSHFLFCRSIYMFESFYKIHLQIRLAKKMASLSSRWTYSGNSIFNWSSCFFLSLINLKLLPLFIVILAVIHLYNMLSEKKSSTITIGIIFYLFSSTFYF